jgi:hypothetical protein
VPCGNNARYPHLLTSRVHILYITQRQQSMHYDYFNRFKYWPYFKFIITVYVDCVRVCICLCLFNLTFILTITQNMRVQEQHFVAE